MASSRPRVSLPITSMLPCIALMVCASGARQNTKGVRIVDLDGKCRIEIDGELFTEYLYRGYLFPILYPVIGAGGRPMTRGWPMAQGPNEARDHPHHRSLWFTHGDVNGHDFWTGGRTKARIVHEKFLAVRSGEDHGILRSRNRWIVRGEEVVCTDERTLTFSGDHNARFLDYEVTIRASVGPLVFGDTKEGTMALRLTPTLRLRGPVARGKVLNSEGVTGRPAWGKRARWVDYHGPVHGLTVGVALFDDPKNPRHPTWWHARDYGLFTANPFGAHDFAGAPKGTGDLRLEKGESLTLRYRFYFHLGNVEQAGVEQHFKEFAAAGSVRPTK